MKKFSLVFMLFLSSIANSADVDLILNYPMDLGDMMPRPGQCTLQYAYGLEGVIQSGGSDICLENLGDTGQFVLRTVANQIVTFTVTVPVVTNSSLIGKVEFTLEGLASNDLGDTKNVLAGQTVNIDSGNSGKVTVIMGGLLDINANLPFGDAISLTYQINY
jgi:hypothetical protein